MTDLVNQSDFQKLHLNKLPLETEYRRDALMLELADSALTVVQADSAGRNINLWLKRLMDIVISSMALVVLGPFLLATALFIRLESPGPALFVQERWGVGMRKIHVYKFRSMYTDKGDHTGVAQTVPGDARITPIGKFIRRTNIDELPQLINVLKGDLSLVGPRCHPVGMIAAGVPYEELVPEYHRRHLLRPGITGLAQANGYRGPTIKVGPSIKRIEYDLKYITKFSVLLDIKILMLTLVRELAGGRGF